MVSYQGRTIHRRLPVTDKQTLFYYCKHATCLWKLNCRCNQRGEEAKKHRPGYRTIPKSPTSDTIERSMRPGSRESHYRSNGLPAGGLCAAVKSIIACNTTPHRIPNGTLSVVRLAPFAADVSRFLLAEQLGSEF